ncbi:MAG: hypothetical protein ACFBWO_17915 [Paracoccaceae bacterium]
MPARIERRTREHLAKHAHFAALVPLAAPYHPVVIDLVDRIERIVAPSGARVLLHPEMRRLERARATRIPLISGGHTDTEMAFLVIDHVGLFVAAREGEAEHRGPLAPWVNADIWPEGTAGIAGHAAWVEIADLGFMRESAIEPLDSAFNRAAAVTAATLAVVDAAEALGVFWHPAKNALPPAAFAAQAGRVIRGEAPLAAWLRYLYLASDDDALAEGVVTKGLAAFTGHEIEVLPSLLPREEARVLAFEFARMVIDRGAVPRTGMIVSPSRQFSATVRVGESRLHPGLAVYELTVSAPVAAAEE